MPSSHLILCRPLLLLFLTFPNIKVFSVSQFFASGGQSFSFSISPSSEYSGFISFRIDWFNLLAVQAQFKNINYLALSLIDGPTFTTVHDYWKNQSFDYIASLIAQLVKNLPVIQETQFDYWVRKIPWRRDKLPIPVFLGIPCGSAGKEYVCNAKDLGLIRGLIRSPGEGKDYPLHYSGLSNSMDCIAHGVTKSLTWLSDFLSLWAIWTFVGKVMSLLFNTLSRFVIAFIPKSKRLLISWLQSPFTVLLEPKKIVWHCFYFFPSSIFHELMVPDAVILVFWMLSFKPACSLSFFTFIRGTLFPLHFLPLGWCHLHTWGCWYFSLKSWFQFVIHPAQHFSWRVLHRSQISRVTIYSMTYPFPNFEPVHCSISSSICCFLTCT